jgi:two-component system sensor histidine kinase UhpB
VSNERTRSDDPALESVRSIAARIQELTLENELRFQQLMIAERRFRSLSRSVWRVQEDERRRLARELHDGIGQTLAALKNQLETARRLDGRSPEQTAASIGEALEIASQALQETRDLSRLLRPAVLDDLGLFPALRWLARTVGSRFSIDVDLELQGADERFDLEIETLAFRVIQEALTNVAKHSGATSATVEVERSADRLRIRVSDPGRGFDPQGALGVEREAGLGLRGMRDRAELFGGSVRVDSEPGRGAQIEILVPLAPPESEPTS